MGRRRRKWRAVAIVRDRALAGVGSQVTYGGQRVPIPSETRITFVLDNPTSF
jgi:hypothetical protein